MRLSIAVLSLCSIGLSVNLANAFTPSSDGLYVVFDTSAGEFTARLDYDVTPLTVANFVRLAEGSIASMDLQTGDLEARPFYDGISFHRVSPGFVIQGGSPNGQGNDGPGYLVPDEFVTGQTHDSAGILSMANSGPNSNGSQFFVTLAAAPNLDWRHSVFGSVIDGMDVVNVIGSADLVAGTETPVAPVAINGIEIIREGAAALAWDETAPVLPQMTYNPLTIEPAAEADQVELFFMRRPFTRNYLSTTTSLETWSILGSRGETIEGPVVESFERSDIPGAGARFYRAIEDQKIVPENMDGYSLRLIPPLTIPIPGITVNFGGDFSGTYEHIDTGGGPHSGTMSYRWFKQENVDVLHLIFDSNLVTYQNDSGAYIYVPNQPQQVSLFFTSAGAGSFTVHYYRPHSGWNAYPDLVLEEGTFLLTAP